MLPQRLVAILCGRTTDLLTLSTFSVHGLTSSVIQVNRFGHARNAFMAALSLLRVPSILGTRGTTFLKGGAG